MTCLIGNEAGFFASAQGGKNSCYPIAASMSKAVETDCNVLFCNAKLPIFEMQHCALCVKNFWRDS